MYVIEYNDGILAGTYINKFGPDCYPSDTSNKHEPKIFETWNDAKNHLVYLKKIIPYEETETYYNFHIKEWLDVDLERHLQSIGINSSKHSQFLPYHYEELKPKMWIWDNKEKDCERIKRKLEPWECEKLYHDKYKKVLMCDWYAIEFEENRFFPIQMAEKELLELYGLKTK